MIRTHEGAIAHEHSLDHHVEFFSKAGSLYSKREHFYAGAETALSLFQKCWIVDKEKAMKLLFWLRDCRGGAGNRSGFRECASWLVEKYPKWIKLNIPLFVEHGRWDDLKILLTTSLKDVAVKYWADALEKGDGLAAKWVSRNSDAIPIRKALGLSPKDFRKKVSALTKVVETDMCKNNWNEIKYPHVPSKAMSLYTNAFKKHDADRFTEFKAAVTKGEVKINTSVLFPHDCVRTNHNGDQETARLQFDALPDYLSESNQRIMVLADTSGSMETKIAGSIRAIDVCVGLALYCSDRLGKKNPFYRKFMQFCDEGKLADWKKSDFSNAVGDKDCTGGIFNGAVGSTRIDKALDTLLSLGTMFNATDEQMPNVLLIISDMQFSNGTRDSGNKTVVAECMEQWTKAGFKVPKIVYWNLSGDASSPDTVDSNNVGLISGFSPSILKAVFSGEKFDPISIMNRAIEKYKITIPS